MKSASHLPQPASKGSAERASPAGAAVPLARAGASFSGNQWRLRHLQGVLGAHATGLAAIRVSREDQAEERAARAVADAPGAIDLAPRARAAETGSSLRQALGPGSPLSPAAARDLTRGAGSVLDGARVHVGEKASRTAEAFGARAFTLGQDIVFGEAAYDPHSQAGRRLLAHELAHVAQHAAIPRIFLTEETEAEVDQRVLKGLIGIVAAHPTDDDGRLDPLVTLFASVTQSRIGHLYGRLDPGAPTDDFAQYFKDKFTKTRADGLAFLRNNASGGLPGSSKGPTGDVAANTVTAATALPTGISFGYVKSGKGWFFNPRYWVVKYILKKGTLTKEFTSAEGQPTPFEQLQAFMDTDAAAAFENGTFDVQVGFGKFGGAAALNDLWNVASISKYAFDCLNAAWLVQLRGQYLSYPAASRDTDFDRDNKSYVMKFSPEGLPTRSNAGAFDEITLPAPVPLSDPNKLSAALKAGDEATIDNPFVKSDSAFRKENIVYLGNLMFMGHPFGTFTLREYARQLIRYAPATLDSDTAKVDWVLEHTSIQNISRPKAKP